MHFAGGIADIQAYIYSDNEYPVEVFDLFCNGNESSLSQCQFERNSEKSCPYYYDIHCFRGIQVTLSLIRQYIYK